MKTTVKTIAAGLFLTASIFGVSASDLSTTTYKVTEITDYELGLEDWMVNSEFFETPKVETATSTVVQIAASNPDFSILVEAVTKAGLVDALSAKGPFTVFAPTNEAFKALFKQLGVSGVTDLTAEQLTPILTYHVVSGKVMSTDLTNTSVATLNGQKIKIDLSNGVKINESKVTKADISGKNGIIHVIDRVLLPK
jgi:uncharacterized surface protein with fasciclin (FAS1) repeats